MTSEITQFNPPSHFRDSMVKGSFRRLDHDHWFEPFGPDGKGTVMRDLFDFASPFGPIGWIVNGLLLTKYMRKLLEGATASSRKLPKPTNTARYLA